MKEYFSNGWNWVWLCGGIIGTWYFYFLEEMYTCIWWIPVILIGIGVLKESGDSVYKKTKWRWMGTVGFDLYGFDIRDIGMLLLGIFIAFMGILWRLRWS